MTAGRPALAVVDVGSNSIRLFLCAGVTGGLPAGPRWTQVTGLRRGAGADGRIAGAAIARLSACLAGYGRRIAAAGSPPVVAVGTSAVRDAPNRDGVAAVVAMRLGASLAVLAGEREATLAYRGALLAVPAVPAAAVIDVGGGSTELVAGVAGRPRRVVSLDLGSTRCTEAMLSGDPPAPEGLARLRATVARQVDARFGPLADVPLVGVAGTVTSLAAIELGGYDPIAVHGRELTLARIDALVDRLAAAPLAERRALPGLDPKRAETIVAGAAIVAAATRAMGADRLTVSERDILDGIALTVVGGGPDAAWFAP